MLYFIDLLLFVKNNIVFLKIIFGAIYVHKQFDNYIFVDIFWGF